MLRRSHHHCSKPFVKANDAIPIYVHVLYQLLGCRGVEKFAHLLNLSMSDETIAVLIKEIKRSLHVFRRAQGVPNGVRLLKLLGRHMPVPVHIHLLRLVGCSR